MSNNQNRARFSTKRLTLDAVFVALYFALSMLAVNIGGVKLTFEGMPVIICAVLFGPGDAVAVGALGEFLNQMMTYGFTPTTVLWMLPAIFRGLSIGLCAKYGRKYMGLDALLGEKYPIVFTVACALSGIVCSCINTFTFYVDSKMFGYYSYAMVFGVFWVRIGSGIVASVLMAAVTRPVVKALRRAKIV